MAGHVQANTIQWTNARQNHCEKILISHPAEVTQNPLCFEGSRFSYRESKQRSHNQTFSRQHATNLNAVSVLFFQWKFPLSPSANLLLLSWSIYFLFNIRLRPEEFPLQWFIFFFNVTYIFSAILDLPVLPNKWKKRKEKKPNNLYLSAYMLTKVLSWNVTPWAITTWLITYQQKTEI